MIRINLLPQRREAKGEQSQAWVGVVMGVLFIELAALFFYHQSKVEELERHKKINKELQAQISEIQKTVANHEAVKQQLGVFKAREEAIAKLQSGRTGPTAVMLELARVLTTGRGPTVDPDKLAQLRKDNPLAVPNANWDAKRLWLTVYKEVERTVTLEGLAKDGEDVSELVRRLSLSNYFSDVKLLNGTKVRDEQSKTDMMKFQLQAKVKY